MRVLIILLVLCVGCASYIPAPKVLNQIKQMPYITGKFVCWHKAMAYHHYLEASGYKSRVVVGKCYQGYDKHAWVEVEKNGKWYVIDPTDTGFDDGYEAKYYRLTTSDRENRRVKNGKN